MTKHRFGLAAFLLLLAGGSISAQAQTFLRSQAVALACPGTPVTTRAGIANNLQTYSGPAGTFTGYVGKEKYFKVDIATAGSTVTFNSVYQYDPRWPAGHLFLLSDTNSNTTLAAMTSPDLSLGGHPGGFLTYTFASAGRYYISYDSKSTVGTPAGTSMDFIIVMSCPSTGPVTFPASIATAIGCDGISNTFYPNNAGNRITEYSGVGGTFSGYVGSEKYYKLTYAVRTSVLILFNQGAPDSGPAGADQDLFLLSDTTSNSVIASLTSTDIYGPYAIEMSLAPGTYYVAIDNKSGYSGTSNLYSYCRCVPELNLSPCASGNGLTGFQLSNGTGISRPACNTAADGYYAHPRAGDFLGNQIGEIALGKKNPFTATFGANPQKLKIWADLNHDWDFDDAGEAIYMNNTASASLSDSLFIPLTTPLSLAEYCYVRVRSFPASQDISAVTACQATGNGETWDFNTGVRTPPIFALRLVDIPSDSKICPGKYKLQIRGTEDAVFPAGGTWTVTMRLGGNTTGPVVGTKINAYSRSPFFDTVDIVVPAGAINADADFAIENSAFTARFYTTTFNNPWHFHLVASPGAIVTMGDTVCSGSAASLSVKSPVGQTQYRWFTGPAGGTAIQSSASPALALGSIGGNTTRFVELTAANGCLMARVPATAAISTPDVVSASPSSGAVGAKVQILGTGFGTGIPAVTFGGVPADSVRRISATRIDAKVPVGLSFPQTVSLKVAFPGCSADSINFNVTNQPYANWPITFGGAGSDDEVRGVVRDASGNFYVSICFKGIITLGGATITSGQQRDGIIAKLNDAGTLLWYSRIGNSTFGMEPKGVNVDGAGNPYWAGSFAGNISFAGSPAKTLSGTGGYDAFVARFDPLTGNCLWATKVGSTGGDYLYACFVSNSGNTYAGGSFGATMTVPTASGVKTMTNAGGLDGFIVKIDPSGQIIWTNQCSSTANDEVKSIEYMGGDLVACGYMGNNCQFGPSITRTTVSGSRDGWLSRINSLGEYVWVKGFGSIFNDEAQAICIDNGGNVCVTAQTAGLVYFAGQDNAPRGFGGVGPTQIAVLSMNFYTQAENWITINGAANDIPTAIRWDGQRLLVTGYNGIYNGGAYPFRAYNTATTRTDYPALGGQDALLMRYNAANGYITSGLRFGGTGDDRALALAVNMATREAYVGGRFSGTADLPVLATTASRTSNGGYDGFLTRITNPAGARLDEETVTRDATGTLTLSPNPATRQLAVQVSDEGAAAPTCLDLQGRPVVLPVVRQGNVFRFDVSGLKAGIYLVRSGAYTARFIKQ